VEGLLKKARPFFQLLQRELTTNYTNGPTTEYSNEHQGGGKNFGVYLAGNKKAREKIFFYFVKKKKKKNACPHARWAGAGPLLALLAPAEVAGPRPWATTPTTQPTRQWWETSRPTNG
jgi:hypothetical protein